MLRPVSPLKKNSAPGAGSAVAMMEGKAEDGGGSCGGWQCLTTLRQRDAEPGYASCLSPACESCKLASWRFRVRGVVLPEAATASNGS